MPYRRTHQPNEKPDLLDLSRRRDVKSPSDEFWLHFTPTPPSPLAFRTKLNPVMAAQAVRYATDRPAEHVW